MDPAGLEKRFASQVIAFDRGLQMAPTGLNVHGCGMALGHPTGCSGTRIIVHLLH